MPIMPNLKRVLILGSGPIAIGQAAEFDYAGTQACQALREEGIEVVLLNSNPATIMTDPRIAGCVYLEPMTVDVVAKIIKREQPDGVIVTMGGQTALNLALDLDRQGILAAYRLPILGTSIAAIQLAEDRNRFRQLMYELHQPVPPSRIVREASEAEEFVGEVGFPVVVRPAYTLGGTGGGMVSTMDELMKNVRSGLRQSPIGQVLLEQSIAGLTEVEYEVVRDGQGHAVIVCDMENIDPVGIHTGDSMVVAPAQTLPSDQKHLLETAALTIVDALGVEGSCNVQFAVNQRTGQYYVIEVNPRVSRSSALASKATGYPIARIAAKIALGYTLPELDANRRSALDYVVTKLPRWPFDKFPHADRKLGTQMQATGEVMGIGATLAESWQKAARSLELKWESLFDFPAETLSASELEQRLRKADDQRLYLLVEALKRGWSIETLGEITSIHPYFLSVLQELVEFHKELSQKTELTLGDLREAKRLGFSDAAIGRCFGLSSAVIRELRHQHGITPRYAQIEWGTEPYYYSTYQQCLGGFANAPANAHKDAGANVHAMSSRRQAPAKPGIVVLGSGPIRIGQGIEFDYATVHAAWAIKNSGYQAVIINNNPETVSTDSSTSDRLYFEPLTPEDVYEVIHHEQPVGVMAQFGGQTAINLAEFLAENQIPIIGTQAEAINKMEDRRQFDQALEELQMLRPQGVTAASRSEALTLAKELVYPVVVRPSYVLGGRGMEVIHGRDEMEAYLEEFSEHQGYPLLIDRYLAGTELEVDAVSDGTDVFVPGIMEHMERSGVHSGDSIAVFPAQSLGEGLVRQIFAYTKRLACHFNVKGLINIQFVYAGNQLYILEVNPRASRTVPFLSKATGIPLAQLAAGAALGKSLKELGYSGLYRDNQGLISVKVPVFSFGKLHGVETALGPEMKSTGEAMGRDRSLAKALYKGFAASSVQLPAKGKVLVTVADKDKQEIIPIARKMHELGLEIYATSGTARVLQENGLHCQMVTKLNQSNQILDLIEQNQVDLVVNTYTVGKQPQRDGFRIRVAASESGVPCFTSLDTVTAYLKVVEDQQLWLEPLYFQEAN